jgi:hypothetical protein
MESGDLQLVVLDETRPQVTAAAQYERQQPDRSAYTRRILELAQLSITQISSD